MTTPDPTNKPAPMTPPIAIIVRWRCLRPVWRCEGSLMEHPILCKWARTSHPSQIDEGTARVGAKWSPGRGFRNTRCYLAPTLNSLLLCRGHDGAVQSGHTRTNGTDGPQGVDEVAEVLRTGPGRKLHRHGPGRRVDVHHLAVDPGAGEAASGKALDEPELVAIPPAGKHSLVVRCSEGLPDIGAGMVR